MVIRVLGCIIALQIGSKMATASSISTERFLDVGCESQQYPSPIEGYELKPVVPLEEAVRPLESLISDIQTNVWTATGNTLQEEDGLLPNERAAIYLYTMNCIYRELNTALRSEERDKLVPYFSYLKLFLTALWKLPDFQDTVWRGVKENLTDQYPPGKQFSWWGLSSCTSSLSILQKDTFLGDKGKRTLFNIQCFNGKKIDKHSRYPGESEILLLPCSRFEVKGAVIEGPDLSIIHIKQIDPPVILIKPPFEGIISPSNSKPHTIQIMTDTSNQLKGHLGDKSSKITTSEPKTTLDLNVLKKKLRLTIQKTNSFELSLKIRVNDKYLLYYQEECCPCSR